MSTPFPNQPPPYAGRNLYADDVALQEAVAREGAAWAHDDIARWGETLGTAETLALGEAANRHPPELRTHDAGGERLDAVDFHPAWHALMALAAEAGEHCSPWTDPGPGAQVARAAKYVLHAQTENGTQCPLTMTYASVPALRRAAAALPTLRDTWLPRILARDYDPRPLPVGEKRAVLIGMGMTERQGGSDVRSNRTEAAPADDGTARLTGHKWFFSAPQCDAHLVLAQDAAGLSCYLLPRFLADGTRNAVRIVRLKDKLGNRSNASSEVEFDRALAWPIGEPGRGVATILEMVQHTRLDCVLGTAGMMRAAVARAIHHARHRVAFGAALVAQPLMGNVLADLALESEAATALALRLARMFDAPEGHTDRMLARLVTPAAKYWLGKRGPPLAAEAMEVLGGNGYVEESMLPRLYREMPVNSIWEGSGNVMCLDVLRAARREPEAIAVLVDELAAARGVHRTYDAFVDELAPMLSGSPADPASARRLAQAVATALQASLLLRHAPAFVAEAFCVTRLAPTAFGGASFGLLPRGLDAGAIVARALPVLWPGQVRRSPS
jgi:putative acyl-CoA dehydrogenase